MSNDTNIILQASTLIEAHGDDAPIEAALRAQARLDQGDDAGYALCGASAA